MKKPVHQTSIIIGIPMLFGDADILSRTLTVNLSHMQSFQNVTFVIFNNTPASTLIPDTILYRLRGINPDAVRLEVVNNKKNVGYFYPLKQLYKKYGSRNTYDCQKGSPYIGLMHSDVEIYTQDWDAKILKIFQDLRNKQMGLLGLFGWKGVSERGNDLAPVGNHILPYRGDAFRKIAGLHRVATIDSLFMLFRSSVIPYLTIEENIMIKHFYDKIWPFRIREHGYDTCALGLSFQHISNPREKSEQHGLAMQQWFNERWGTQVPIDRADDMAYFEGWVRYVSEYRDIKHMIPYKI